jgi:hypothetical protein
MIRKLLTILVLSFLLISASAQISGRIVNSTGVGIPFCNVTLLRTIDSALVTGSTTDTTGCYSLEIKDTGSVFVQSGYIGYKKFSSFPILITDKNFSVNLGSSVLEEDSKMLKDVEIIAQKSFIEHKVDRTVYNIQNSIISAGNNGLEVLKKLPGVTVDGKESVEVRGKPGVLVTIDGRNLYMSAGDLANYLKSLDASQIDKIEVITNPSAKYDASGYAIINIVLLKDKNLGLNGNVSTMGALGFYYGANVGLSLNYRTRKLNFFFTGYQWKFKRYDASYQQSIFTRNNITHSVFKDTTRNVFSGEGTSLRGGMDYFIDEKQTLGVMGEMSRFEGVSRLTDATSIYNSDNTLNSSLYTAGKKNFNNLDWNVNLNYKNKIGKGKEFFVNGIYAGYETRSTETDITNFYNENNISIQTPRTLFYKLPTKINILAGNIDYEQTFLKDVKVEVGIKASSVQTDNNAEYWNVINGIEFVDSSKTNHFIYSEYIYAAYINFSKSYKKIDIQAGLRAENTDSKGVQQISDSVVHRSYLNLFPSCYVNWRADSSNTINVSYSRRIDRPDYGNLNPFQFYRNPYSYGTGNPYLRPQISNNFLIEHVFRNKLTTSVGFLHMEDVISAVIHQDDSTQITYTSNENVSKYDSYNILFSLNLQPTKWWSVNTSVNSFYDHYYGPTEQGFYSRYGFTCIIHMLNTLSFRNNWGIEVAVFYRSVNVGGFVVNDPIYNLSAGIRKGFAKGKGNVRLSCDDILWSDRLTNKMSFEGVNYKGTFFSDSRRIRLSLSWKLGRSQYEREERKKSAQDEMNRIK